MNCDIRWAASRNNIFHARMLLMPRDGAIIFAHLIEASAAERRSASITTPLASNARTTLSTLPASPRTGLAPDVSMRLMVEASMFARRANSTLVRPASALAALSMFPEGCHP